MAKKLVSVSKAKVVELDFALLIKGVDGNKLSYAEKVKIGEILYPNGIEVEAFVPNWNYISRDYLGFTGMLKRAFINPYYRVSTYVSNGYTYTKYFLETELDGKSFRYWTKNPDEYTALIYYYIWEELMILPKLELNFVENNAWEKASDSMKEKYKEYIGKTPREMLDIKRKENGYYIKNIDEIVQRELAYGGKYIEYVKSNIKSTEKHHK